MKTLNEYVGNRQTKLHEELGAFFAFGNEQFNEKREEGVKYIQTKAGLIVPKEKIKEYYTRSNALYDEAITACKNDYSKEDIIRYQLGNHEAQITMDIEDTVEAVKCYGFTREDVQKVYTNVFMPSCVEANLF